MNALIVYDSVFGNTEKVACAIGAAIGASSLPKAAMRPTQLLKRSKRKAGSWSCRPKVSSSTGRKARSRMVNWNAPPPGPGKSC
jgi:hypothetical protein